MSIAGAAICAKCNRPPKDSASSVSCPNPKCGNLFHTGCLKVYILYETASRCCKNLFKLLESEGAYPSMSVSGGRRGGRSALSQAAASLDAGADLASIPIIELPPERTAEPLPSGWNDMSERDRNSKIMEALMGIHKAVDETRSAVVSVAPVVNAHTRILSSHEQRIGELESKPAGRPLPTSELIIDNLPLNCCADVDPIDIAKRVLATMNLSDLNSELLSVKEFKRNQTKQTISLSAYFKNNFTRDYVIDVKRKFGVLKRNQILGPDAGEETV